MVPGMVQPTSYTDAVRLVPEDPSIFFGVQRTLRRLKVKDFDNEYPARSPFWNTHAL